MNSTRKGDILENSIARLFAKLIQDGQFWGDSKTCTVYQKKGYYSKDREKDIIFDVAIEFTLPGAARYSMVTLIECKNYSHPVPVDDVEEFFAKAQQVAGANSKLVLASNAAFQDGAIKFARSKGIGLLRYLDASAFKWELHRSPSAYSRSMSDREKDVYDGLTKQNFVGEYFDFYLQSSCGPTNSLWDFFESLFSTLNFQSEHLRALRNKKGRPGPTVPFIEKDEIEELAVAVLRDIDYVSGAVPLDLVCTHEAKKCGLLVTRETASEQTEQESTILGQIAFDPLEIKIYERPFNNIGRERFTLAHELAHHFLSHHKYMVRESCSEDDFSLNPKALSLVPDIARLRGSGESICCRNFNAARSICG